jgi:hypothetical protein
MALAAAPGPTRSLRANPARWSSCHGHAPRHPGEPAIESPGRIRRCAGAARAVATRLEVIDASTVWTRTATERWAVMIGFSTGKLAGWQRRERPAFATRWERSHEVSKGALPSYGSALITGLASHSIGIHVSENRSKHSRGRSCADVLPAGPRGQRDHDRGISYPCSRFRHGDWSGRSQPGTQVLRSVRATPRTSGCDGHGTSRPKAGRARTPTVARPPSVQR